jgi:hypothetical protein
MSGALGQSTGRTQLIAAAQNVTTGWVDLGSEIETFRAQNLGVWLTVDINLATDVRVRALAKHTSAGTEEYLLPIRTVSATAVNVAGEYIEFSTDADQLMLLSWELDGLIPFVQLQLQAGTAGATAGQIDAAYYTLSY